MILHIRIGVYLHMVDYRNLFTVETRPDEALVLIVIKGFFTTDSYAQYKLETIKAILATEKGNRSVRILNDLRECNVQSQDIAKDNEWMMSLKKYVKKNAVVLNSTIHKMQLQRSITGDAMRYFNTMEEAHEWIEEED